MTLFQHTLKALLRGEKTETSRLALPDADGETTIGREMIQYPFGKLTVMQGRGMRWIPKWQVGKDYAIQPARGVKAVGRYRVDHIWKQDVRTLTSDQIRAEGFGINLAFYDAWCWMHDLQAAKVGIFSNGYAHLEYRPAELYTAWRMEISVLWDTVDWEAPAVKALCIDQHERLISALNAPVL